MRKSKAISNVMATIVLIGVTLAAFAVAYPIFFSSSSSITGSIGDLLEKQAQSSGTLITLVDYEIEGQGFYYKLRIWLYNYGWRECKTIRAIVNGYEVSLARTIEPKSFSEITLYIPSSYGYPKNLILILDSGKICSWRFS